jgi:type IV secretion system protein VirB9
MRGKKAKSIRKALAAGSAAVVLAVASPGMIHAAPAKQFTKRILPYTDDAVYAVTAQPFKVVDIRLGAGEQIQALTAGDAERWKIGQAVSAAPDGTQQPHILVKPVLPGLSTNLVVITNFRTYTIDLKSVAPGSRFDPVVEFTYAGQPAHGAVASGPVNVGVVTNMDGMLINNPAPKPQPGLSEEDVQKMIDEKLASVPGSPLSAIKDLRGDNQTLDFDYRIKAKGDYAWTPTHVFDDGLRTYILMPLDVRADEAPALFMVKDKKILVNYRILGRWYIVDRIMDKAELTIRDHKHVERVEIVRHPRRKFLGIF